jgi:hypothetical protein
LNAYRIGMDNNNNNSSSSGRKHRAPSLVEKMIHSNMSSRHSSISSMIGSESDSDFLIGRREGYESGLGTLE